MKHFLVILILVGIMWVGGCASEDISSIQKDNQDLKRKVETLEKEKIRLSSELDQMTRNYHASQMTIANMQKQINTLEAELKQNTEVKLMAEAGPNPQVLMKTSKGDIVIELDKVKAPITVKNFLAYVEDKYYDGLIFHRVISDFMIQGGGFNTQLVQQDTKAPIKNEASNGLTNDRGTIAMARTNDPDSATSQFFINVQDNPNLNYSSGSAGYAVFGKVIKGMNVVDVSRMVPTTEKLGTHKNGQKSPLQNVPVENVVIESVTVIE